MFGSRGDSENEEEEACREEALPPVAKPCRVHMHIRRACGLRAALVEAELTSVRKDVSPALTEAVERGPLRRDRPWLPGLRRGSDAI